MRDFVSRYSARFAAVNMTELSPNEIAVPNEERARAANIPAKVIWPVEVVFRKRKVVSRWADFEWEPVEAVMSQSAPPLRCEIEVHAGETHWRWFGAVMDLHPSEGEGYWLNLTSETPCVFVMWRLAEDEGDEAVPVPSVVTASYNEAGRMLDAGDRVDRVPMPEAMQSALAEYTMKFYTPEKRRKVRRNDPFRQASGDAANALIVPPDSPAARGGHRG